MGYNYSILHCPWRSGSQLTFRAYSCEPVGFLWTHQTIMHAYIANIPHCNQPGAMVMGYEYGYTSLCPWKDCHESFIDYKLLSSPIYLASLSFFTMTVSLVTVQSLHRVTFLGSVPIIKHIFPYKMTSIVMSLNVRVNIKNLESHAGD